MMKFIPILGAALATLLIACPVTAATVYENGALNGTYNAYQINHDQSVSNTFSLAHASDLTSATIGLWSLSGDTPTQLDWSIGSTAFSNSYRGTATFSAVTTAFTNSPYEIDLATFSLNLTLGAGDYWLTLQNGLNSADGEIYWDVNGGPPSKAQYQPAVEGDSIESEYFRLSGNDATGTQPVPPPVPGPVAVPEPASWLLLGVGMIGCAAARRRRQAA